MNAVRSIVAGVLCLATGMAGADEVSPNLIPNGSFEGGDTTALHATYKHASFASLPGGWKGKSCGWAQNGTWYGINAKDGSAAAYMQNVSSISNVFVAPYSGEYRVSYWATARSSSMKNLAITTLIDDQVVIAETKIGDASKWIEMTANVSLTVGSHVFAITGVNRDSGDQDVAIDLVSVTAIRPTVGVMVVARTHADVLAADGFEPFLGIHSELTGNQTFTAPADELTTADGLTKDKVTGWKLKKMHEDGSVVVTSGEGTSCTIEILADEYVELEWQMSTQYKVTATAGEGGTVSPTEQWVAEGETATVTASAWSDYLFLNWTGDRSGANAVGCFENVRAPLAVTATFYPVVSVAQDGSDSAAGTEKEPFATVAHAIKVAAARAGELSSVVGVKVGPGTFQQDKELVVDSGIRLIGSGSGVTVLDAQGKSRVMTVSAAKAYVSDFTITGGSGKDGSGVYISAGTLSRCLITGNKAPSNFGGGIYLTGSALASTCIVTNNMSSRGGGVYTWGGKLENSLVCENTSSGDGGGVYVYHGALVRFCTIANNTAKNGGGIYYSTAWGDKAHDLIVWGNSALSNPDISSGDFSKWTNICTSVSVGVNPHTDNPVFRDAANHDYRLAGSSPYRDAAWGVPAPETDVFGNPRVQNGRADVGAIESDPNEKTANMEYEVSGGLDEATVSVVARATNFDIDEADCYWTFDGRVPTATDHDATGVELTYVYTNVGPCSVALAVVFDGKTFVDVKRDIATVAPSVVYLDANNASPAAPYNTREKAANDLATAVNAAAASGTTILVLPGTYEFKSQVVIQKKVKICSEQGPGVTIFNGKGKTSLIKVQVAGAEISGLTLKGGAGDGTVRIEAGVMRNCVLCGGNRGVYLTGSGRVSSCIISNNTGDVTGAGVYTWGGTLENSLICGNTTSSQGGGVYVYHGALVRFCTIAGNTANSGGGIYYSSGWNDKAHDLIVWGNSAISSPDISSGDFSLWTNICSSVSVGVNPQATDPLFKNAANRDYRLAGSSPCRDTAWGVPTTETDVFGNPRVQNERADVGAIESDPNEMSANLEYEVSGGLDKATVTLTAKATNFDINDAKCYWTFDGRTPTAGNHDAEGVAITHVYDRAGSCSVALAVLYDGETFVDVKPDFLTVCPSSIFVDVNCEHPTYPYNTRETAANGLAEALEVAAVDGGSTIFVAPGTYVFAKQVAVQKAVKIRGEGGSDVTIFDGGGKVSLLDMQVAGADVSGISFVRGGGNSPAVRVGAGVLTNCVVRNNTHGGVYLQYGKVTGCIITNNTGNGQGGGVYTWGGTLENSLICGNTGDTGGGVYVYHGVVVRNCTIVNNTANNGGGIYYNALWGDKAYDNIIWGNTAKQNPEINPVSDQYYAGWMNNCSTGAVGENTSENDLRSDPLFQNAAKGDYRLRAYSPCRNAAWGKPTTAVDLDGNPRLRYRKLDIGCYECQIGPGMMLMVK